MPLEGTFKGFNISSAGLSVQRKKMNLISENIANADTVRNADGTPFKRKFLEVQSIDSTNGIAGLDGSGKRMVLHATAPGHVSSPMMNPMITGSEAEGYSRQEVIEDTKEGEIVYMPDHPDADDDGYVEMSNVNIINEMVDMIAATRSYEANLTALNATKENIKDSLEI